MQTNIQNSHIHTPYNMKRAKDKTKISQHIKAQSICPRPQGEQSSQIPTPELSPRGQAAFFPLFCPKRFESCSEHQHILSLEAHLALYQETRMFIEQKAKHRDTLCFNKTKDKETENVWICVCVHIYRKEEREWGSLSLLQMHNAIWSELSVSIFFSFQGVIPTPSPCFLFKVSFLIVEV